MLTVKNHYKKITILFSAAVIYATTLVANATGITAKDAETAWYKVDAGAVLIDVRTPEEFAAGHLKNAINVPYEQILDGVSALNISKQNAIVVYCRSGRRSGIANDALLKAGYSDSYNGGGFIPLSQYRNNPAL